MKCPYCGTEIANNARFCPECGTSLSMSDPAAPVNPTPSMPSNPYPASTPVSSPQPAQANPLGMKWYKFIIWFQLFASALMGLVSAVNLFNGSVYGDEETAQLVYYYYPSLKSIDSFYALALVALAIASIYVRFQLSGFKKDGPKYYIWLLAASIVVSIIYLVLVSTALGSSDALGPTPSVTIVFSAILLIANKKYFENRQHMFVN